MPEITEISPEEKAKLKLELKELQTNIRELEITSNRRQFARNTISDADMDLHKKWGNRIREIEAIFSAQKTFIGKAAQDDMIFKELLKETFGYDDYLKIMQEYNRRRGGEPSHRISMQYKDSTATALKKKLNEAYEQLKLIRKTLTEINLDGCERFGIAEFMKIISPINTKVPPIEEINKMQRQIN